MTLKFLDAAKASTLPSRTIILSYHLENCKIFLRRRLDTKTPH
jgi:hypothetical protein